MSKRFAVVALQPHCPECLQALATPPYFSQLPVAEKLKVFTIHCPNCNHVVHAPFFGFQQER